LWPPFGTAGQAQTGRIANGKCLLYKAVARRVLVDSSFGPEEATNFDQPATGKTISGFLWIAVMKWQPRDLRSVFERHWQNLKQIDCQLASHNEED
jgi:hypothetical protein